MPTGGVRPLAAGAWHTRSRSLPRPTRMRGLCSRGSAGPSPHPRRARARSRSAPDARPTRIRSGRSSANRSNGLKGRPLVSEAVDPADHRPNPARSGQLLEIIPSHGADPRAALLTIGVGWRLRQRRGRAWIAGIGRLLRTRRQGLMGAAVVQVRGWAARRLRPTVMTMPGMQARSCDHAA